MTSRYRELSTGSPGLGAETASSGRRPCQQVIQQQEESQQKQASKQHMRSGKADTSAKLRGIPLRILHTSAFYSAWVFGRPPSERGAAENFLQVSKHRTTWDISFRQRGNPTRLRLDPSKANPFPPRNPAAPRVVATAAGRAIGSFGLALGEIYLAKRQ